MSIQRVIDVNFNSWCVLIGHFVYGLCEDVLRFPEFLLVYFPEIVSREAWRYLWMESMVKKNKLNNAQILYEF